MLEGVMNFQHNWIGKSCFSKLKIVGWLISKIRTSSFRRIMAANYMMKDI